MTKLNKESFPMIIYIDKQSIPLFGLFSPKLKLRR